MKKIPKLRIAKQFRSISNPKILPKNYLYNNNKALNIRYKLIKNTPRSNVVHLPSLNKNINYNFKYGIKSFSESRLPLINKHSNNNNINHINNLSNVNKYSIFNSEQKKFNFVSKVESINNNNNKIYDYNYYNKDFHSRNNISGIKYKLNTSLQIKNKNKLNNNFNDLNSVSKSSEIFCNDIIKTTLLNLGINKEAIKNYAYNTRPGKKENKVTKINQDSYLINFQINNIKNFHMFGILDGHGTNGHFASQLTVKFLINFFKEDSDIQKADNLLDIYNILKMNNYNKIKDAYTSAEKSLSENKSIDFSFSGTTCVIVFIIGKHIICSNAGDSRAIMFSKENSRFTVSSLSHDHKPNLPKEEIRIINMGGVVERFKQNGVECGPSRVWVSGKGYPGLAMSRSIGDLVGSRVGVIPEPEIYETEINENTKGIFIASDGIWEFISNLTVLQSFKHFYEINCNSKFCQFMVNEAVVKWSQEDIVIDDITCVSVFL